MLFLIFKSIIMNQKPESIIKYKPLKVVINDQLKGIKIEMLHSRLDPNKKILLIFPKWNKTKLILWKADLTQIQDSELHPKVQKDKWIILSENMTSYNSAKFPFKHICKDKRLLKILNKY